jgi:hypothetical protein
VKPPPGAHVVKSLALLDWALGNGWAWPTKNEKGEEDLFAACILAAWGGCIAVMQRARADGCQWNWKTCASAAAFGQL